MPTDPNDIPPPMPPDDGEPTVEGDGPPVPGPPPPRPPAITQVSPIAGSPVGGIIVTLAGSRFQQGAAVFFGNAPSPDVSFVSSTTLQAVLPAAPNTGSVSVAVFNPDGGRATRAGGFT